MKRCPYCAEEIQDEAVVCRFCGRDLAPTPQPPPQQVVIVRPKKKTGCVAGGCALVFIVLATAVVVTICSIPHAPVATKSSPAENEAARVSKAARGLANAEKVVASPKDCKNPILIVRAWNDLRETKPSDAQWTKAQEIARKLDACRAAALPGEIADQVQSRITGRREYAELLQTRYLDKRINATVTTAAAKANRLTIKWALVSRVTAHQMSKGDLLQETEGLGFARVTITDGYDETWYWDLKPQTDDAAARQQAAKDGLAGRFSLGTGPQ